MFPSPSARSRHYIESSILDTYLGGIRAIVYRHVEASPQSTLRVAASQELPNLAGELADFSFADLGLRGLKGRCVEVDAGVLGELVNVYGAPGVAERGVGVLLDDRHGCAIVSSVRGAYLVRGAGLLSWAAGVRRGRWSS